MKITCQECQSNFSVADEKVAGTVVKIRCKKCGATMVVNGKDGTTTTERKSLPDDAPALSGSDVTEAASSEESEPRAALREGGRDKSKDLFGDAASAGSEGDSSKTEAKLTGGRNESSVLFSLKSLTKEGDAAPAKDEGSKTTASGDGSGLIDIRALAGKKSDDKPSAAVDDILSLGGGGAFGPSLTAPNLAAAPVETTPSEAPKEKNNRGIIFAIIGSAVFLGVVIVIAVVATRPSGDATRPDPVTTTSASPGPQPSAEPPKVAQATPQPTETTTAKPPGELPTSIPSSGHGAVAAATPTVTKPLSLEEELRKKAGQPTTAPTKPADTGGGGSFDRAAAGISLGGINIASCKKPDGPTGSGHVTVTFDPSGSVQSAIIDGGPFPGTPVGGCIAGKYRGAHVPAFSGSPVKVGKSFTL